MAPLVAILPELVAEGMHDAGLALELVDLVVVLLHLALEGLLFLLDAGLLRVEELLLVLGVLDADLCE